MLPRRSLALLATVVFFANSEIYAIELPNKVSRQSEQEQADQASNANAIGHPLAMPANEVHNITQDIYYSLIQQAIDGAVDGDVIVLSPGTYTGVGNRELDFQGKAITLRSTNPNDAATVASTVIDCQANGGGFNFHTAEGADSVILGLTVTNASRSGIVCTGASPTIADCVITGNVASNGAGIYCSGASPAIIDSVITNNAVTTSGGGMYIDAASSPVVTRCAISLNHADEANGSGGGIYTVGNLTLQDSTLSDNTTNGSGGGINGAGAGTTELIQVTISGNTASANGGGARVAGGTWIVRQSTIAENRATNSGGGIYRESGTVTVTNSLIAFNTAATGLDVSGTFASPESQYNLIRVLDGSMGLSETNSITGTLAGPLNPRMALLGNSGGPTLTHALLPNSPALNSGSNALALDVSGQPLSTDQRGQQRFAGTVDIGAVEGTISSMFQLTAPPPPATVSLGRITPISWDQTTLPAGSIVRLYYDADTLISGNENWIVVDLSADAAKGSYNWAPVLLQPGTYYIGGEVVDPFDQTLLQNRIQNPITVQYHADYVVDSLTDVVANDGVITLREALNSANANDNSGIVNIIAFDPSLSGQTIELTNGELPIANSTWIQGLGSLNLTVDGNSFGRIFKIDAPAGTQVWISGLTLERGKAENENGGGIYATVPLVLEDVTVSSCQTTGGTYGGGIYSTAPLTVRDATISGNSSYSGGGIYSTGQLTIEQATVSGNSSTNYGGVYCQSGDITESLFTGNSGSANGSVGGLFHAGGTLAVSDTQFTGNSGASGGIRNNAGTLTLDQVDLSGNRTNNSAGGGLSNSGVATIRNSTIASNYSTTPTSGSGGGIYNTAGTLVVENSTISDNQVGVGGGIYGYSGTGTLVQVTISGNRAAGGSGGGIFVANGDWTIRQSTIANNDTSADGGGIYRSGGTVKLCNTIVTGNSARELGYDLRGTFDSSSFYNLVRIADDSIGIDPDPNKHNLTGTLAAPLAAWVGMLADNGGLTKTHQLLTGSPAIDGGSDSCAVDSGGQPLTMDQRGTGFPRLVGAALDIGAVEGQTPAYFELTGTVPPVVEIGSVLPIDWTQGTIPLSEARLSLYVDTDATLNGNEFWIVRDANPDDLLDGYDWRVVGLADLSAQYTLGGVLKLSTGEEYHSRMDESFQVAYGGTIYTVTSLDNVVANDGKLTLPEAVKAASLNQPLADAPAGSANKMDVILFAPELSGGTIELSGFELAVTDDLYIQGPGATFLTVDGTLQSRVFKMTGNDKYVWINGLSIMYGKSTNDNGGGIYNGTNLRLDDVTVSSCQTTGNTQGGGVYSTAPLTVSDATISGNSGYYGGGIYSTGQLTMEQATVSGNSSTYYGGVYCQSGDISESFFTSNSGPATNGVGGLYHAGGTLTVSDTQFTGNSGATGGIRNNAGTLTLEQVELSGNRTNTSTGGGLFNSGVATIRNSTIASNYSTTPTSGSGGGIYNNAGTLVVENSTISDNHVGTGGGIYANTGTGTLVQVTISGNWAHGGNGGGMFVANGDWTIRQSTIANNYASGEGGGIYRGGGTVTLCNTVVADNTAAALGQDIRGAFSTDSNYNLVGICNDSIGLCDDPHTLGGTLTSPLDPKLGALADNGGLTKTHNLLVGSPALDYGVDSCAVDSDGQPLTTDQRGVGYPRIVGGTVDIGAVEGTADIVFELTGTVPPVVEIGSVLPIAWTQGTIPLSEAKLSLYVDTDATLNGNEFWIVRDANPDDLLDGYEWRVIGLGDLSATYTIGAVLKLDTGAEYHSRMDESFQVAYGGTVYTVTSLDNVVANDGELTLPEAVKAASLNQPQADAPAGSANKMDVILFAPELSGGTIELSGFELAVTDDLYIQGPGATFLTVDGNLQSRVFEMTRNDKYVWINGLSVMYGKSTNDNGGGIYNGTNLRLDDVTVSSCQTTGNTQGGGVYSTAPLTVRDVTISGNSSYSGGGIFSTGRLTMEQATVSGNSSTYYGGVYCQSGDITESFFTGNSGSSGVGALYHAGGTLAVSDTQFTGNSGATGGIRNNAGTLTLEQVDLSGNAGGGLYNNGVATVRNSTITSNYSTTPTSGSGGGIYNNAGTLVVESSTISDNHVGTGGGIYGYGGTGTLVQVTISGNGAAGGSGGGMLLANGDWTIRQSTIANNDTSADGGGIYRSGGIVTLYNTIVAINTADGVGDDTRGAFSTDSRCNLIGVVNDSTGLGDDPCTMAGTIGAPLAPGLLPLAPCGWSLAHPLKPASPAIDAGSNDLAVDSEGNSLQNDQCGAPRFQLARVDIGAVEYQGTSNAPPTINPSSLTLSADPVYIGDSLTLSIPTGAVQDDHHVASVSFYRDENLDGVATPNELLATDTDGTDGWSWSATVSWPLGMHNYLAVATDDGYPTGVLQGDAVSVIGTVLAAEPPHITVGDHVLLANRAEQRVPIYVTGLDEVTGFDFVAQLGDGNGPGAEPVFASVDFSGSIWDAHPHGGGGGPVSGAPMYIDAGVAFSRTWDQTRAEGLLMTLVIDTRGFEAGQVFDLKLKDTGAPVEPAFVLYNAEPLHPVITDGTIRLYETAVVGRYIFYNNSVFDGDTPGADSADNDAIATDKAPLFPGQRGSFLNYTSFEKGINGVMLDVAGLQSPPTLDDFEFHVGNVSDTNTWDAAPDPVALDYRQGNGAGGSDRISLIWPDEKISKQWLEVRFKAANTGLDRDDVFYFGNAIADVGNSPVNSFVDGTDFAAARDNFSDFLHPAAISERYDFDRDTDVGTFDMSLVVANYTNFLTALRLIAPPPNAAVAALVDAAPATAAEDVEVTPSINITVGTRKLVAGRSHQRINLYVSATPEAPPVSGFNLRAQIGDGDAGNTEPVFGTVEFAGGIWDPYPVMIIGGVLPGHEQYAQASVVFKQSGELIAPDGQLVTLTVDTTGFSPGQTFDLKLTSTDIGQNSDFIIVGDQVLEPTIINGTIALVEGPTWDADADRDVDLSDHAIFADCMAGPDADPNPTSFVVSLTSQECLDAFDADHDGDVDLFDFSIFELEFGTPQ